MAFKDGTGPAWGRDFHYGNARTPNLDAIDRKRMKLAKREPTKNKE